MDASDVADIMEIQQLLARYAVGMTMADVEIALSVFAPGGTHSAFGDEYGTDDFPTLMASAPKGLFRVGPSSIELDVDTGRGLQPLCFVAQADSMRIEYYADTCQRTPDGWRPQARARTFLRRNGARDSGRPYDPRRPRPTRQRAG
jgi:hypothetical protein